MEMGHDGPTRFRFEIAGTHAEFLMTARRSARPFAYPLPHPSARGWMRGRAELAGECGAESYSARTMAEEPPSSLDELSRLRSENWRLTHELAEERARFQHTVDTPLVGYLISSFEQGKFLEVNQAYCDFLGFLPEEVLASDPYQHWLATTFAEDLEIERHELQRVVNGDIDRYRMEKRYLRKDGELRWGDMSFSCSRDDRGRVRSCIVACTDVHEYKSTLAAREKLEGNLLQAQKLETVGRLVGGVAHDFNNRLLVIMGYADLLKRGSAKDPVLAGHAEVVVSSARRAADLTRQLLAYSRRQVLRPRAGDLNAVVDGTRRMLERLIGERVELVTVLGAKFPMLADPGQIEHVLMNLTLNARDAMSDGGRVTLETFDVDATSEEPLEGLTEGPYVALSVTDTGTGIPEATRKHIFEPFFTTKDVGRGTGLGLATVDGIVRQSGGGIAVKSVEGHGSTFTVYLPRAVDTASEPTPTRADGIKADYVPCLPSVESILIVDDEDDVRKLLVDVLRIGAYRVLEARDGEHAIKVAEAHTHPVDLLVTDIVMPGLSGMELADALRSKNPDLKVLFMSGYAERDRIRPLHDHEQFVPKPFLPAEFFRVVNDFLREPSPKVEQTA
jgi:two-component system, cell cycle sensor histidine kinase and response regulator CckA